MEAKPKRRGRPVGTTKPPEQNRSPYTIRLNVAEQEKLEALGGRKWLRAQIEKA